jgi:hypothetical protein
VETDSLLVLRELLLLAVAVAAAAVTHPQLRVLLYQAELVVVEMALHLETLPVEP